MNKISSNNNYYDTIDVDNKEQKLIKNQHIINKNSITESCIDKTNNYCINKHVVNNSIVNNNIHVKESAYRWVIFLSFFMLTFSNGLQWVTFSSIADDIKYYLNIKAYIVDLYSLSYLFCFTLVFPLAAYIIDNKSILIGLKGAALLNLIGSIAKIFITKYIYISLIGQFLNAIAQPFIISSCAKIASLWFRSETRALITSLLALGNVIGTLIGMIFNSFFFNDKKVTIIEYKNSLFNYLLAECIICAIFSLVPIIFLKSKPSCPPSMSQKIMKVPLFSDSIKMLFKNKNFMCLNITFTIIVGYFNLIGTILNQLLSAYNIQRSKINLIGGVGNVLGLLMSIISSLIVDRHKKYKPTFIAFCVIAISSQIILCILSEIFYYNELYSFIVWLICWSFILMACVPCYTIGMDYVCEITYPIGELISGGFILSCSQLLGILETYLSEYFLNTLDKKYLINLMSCILFIFALLSLLFLDEKLVRNNIDEGYKKSFISRNHEN